MKVSLASGIEHVLNVVEAHTGLSLFDREDRIERGDARDGTYTACWISDAIGVNHGELGLVATHVRVQMTTEVFREGEEELIRMKPNGDHQATVTFIFTMFGGHDTAMTRTIRFRGPYFRRFD